MNDYNAQVASVESRGVEITKVIRNTYMLLSATLLFSAVTAMISMAIDMGPMTYLLSLGGAMLLIWLVLPRTANSAAGLGVVFGITGLLGFGLGPILSMYLSLPAGPQIVMTALGGTGVIFIGLSAYALVSGKNFNFMGGFLVAGMLTVLVAALANIFMELPLLSLVISAAVIMLMSGFILYDTSRMVHEPNVNYIMMTVSLYLSIFNIFIHLMNLLAAFANND